MRISDWSSDVCSSDLWKDLPEEVRFVILHGTSGKPATLRFVDGRKSYEVKKPFEGVIGNLNRRLLQTESAWMREELRSEEHTSELQSLMRISYAVFCLKKKTHTTTQYNQTQITNYRLRIIH